MKWNSNYRHLNRNWGNITSFTCILVVAVLEALQNYNVPSSSTMPTVVSTILIDPENDFRHIVPLVLLVIAALTVVIKFIGSTPDMAASGIDRDTNKPKRLEFLTPGDAYDIIKKEASQRNDKRIKLFQYSGAVVQDFVREFLSRGFHVDLYLQDPATVTGLGSTYQAHRITNLIHELQRDVEKVGGQVNIYQAHCPLTIRAVVLNDVICLGWYVYEHRTGLRPNYPDDTLEIHGGDTDGAVLIRSGDPAFGVADVFMRNYEQWIHPEPIGVIRR